MLNKTSNLERKTLKLSCLPTIQQNYHANITSDSNIDILIVVNISDIWYKLGELVKKWSSSYRNVYVISGSIFDANNDGIKDDEQVKIR